MRLPHCIEVMSVRQSHVQQHHVYTAFPQMNHDFAHGFSVLNISRSKQASPALSSTRRTWSALSFMSVFCQEA
jgi:hypothetical protein